MDKLKGKLVTKFPMTEKQADKLIKECDDDKAGITAMALYTCGFQFSRLDNMTVKEAAINTRGYSFAESGVLLATGLIKGMNDKETTNELCSEALSSVGGIE